MRPIFVLNSLEASISVIDPQTMQETRRIPTGKESQHLYLATQKTRWTIPVGKLPADLYLTGDEVVEVYDVSGAKPALVKRIRTGRGAHAFRAKGDRRHVYVSNRVANTVSLIDTQTLAVVDTYPAPGGPDCMDAMADGKRLLVTSRWARKLTVIDLAQHKVVRQVAVGRSPHGVWTLDHAPRL